METMDLTILLLLVGLSGLVIGYWVSSTPIVVRWQPVIAFRWLEQPTLQARRTECVLRCLRYIHHKIITRTGTSCTDESDDLLNACKQFIHISFKGDQVYAATNSRSVTHDYQVVL